jgi:hypothetical protein
LPDASPAGLPDRPIRFDQPTGARFCGAGADLVSAPLPGLIDTVKSREGEAVVVNATAEDVDVPKPALPEYFAVMECAPMERVDMANVAFPVASRVGAPRLVVPSRNVTAPIGMTVQ